MLLLPHMTKMHFSTVLYCSCVPKGSKRLLDCPCDFLGSVGISPDIAEQKTGLQKGGFWLFSDSEERIGPAFFLKK